MTKQLKRSKKLTKYRKNKKKNVKEYHIKP